METSCVDAIEVTEEKTTLNRCTHEYFNKWEGEYFCMDCWYKLSPIDDADRIHIEAGKEASTPVDDLPEDLLRPSICHQMAEHCGWALIQRGSGCSRLWIVLSPGAGLIRFYSGEDCAQSDGAYPLHHATTLYASEAVEGQFSVSLENPPDDRLEMIFEGDLGTSLGDFLYLLHFKCKWSLLFISDKRGWENAIEIEIYAMKLRSHVGKRSQMRGVSLYFLRAFTEKHNCWDKTSWWIIRNIIKPATEVRRCRYVELDDMAEHVGPAQTFISYAQQGTWGDLVAAALDGGADLSRKVWIDVFAIRQWPSEQPDLDFASTIENCESFLCVCSDVPSVESLDHCDVLARKTELIPVSDRKKISFLRVWCLVEIAAAAKKIGMLKVMKCGSYRLNADGSVRFESKTCLLGKLSRLIDIKHAEATVESDKNRILTDIQGSLTIDYLNGVVRGVLAGAEGIADLGDNGSAIQCAVCGDVEAIKHVLSQPSQNILAVAGGGYVKLLEMLLDAGADVNTTNEDGDTALIYASDGGHVSCISLLLDRGACPDARESSGCTALMIASRGGHVASIERLLAAGVDVNAKDNGGRNSLVMAAEGGHIAAVEILEKNGALIADSG